ncbi:TPA: FAD-dependent oxidoreductase [Vibrio parahaemolyticus]
MNSPLTIPVKNALSHIVVVGNGMVGQHLVEQLVQKNAHLEHRITVIGAERFIAYDRVQLSSLFAGKSHDDLMLSNQEWYDMHGIQLVLGSQVTGIDREQKRILLDGEDVLGYDQLVLGEVAQQYDLYTKITGGQRVDLFGAQLEQLPEIWQTLIDAGFETGHAYGKSVRTVKSCVGSTWCRYGVDDSVGLAIELENRYKGLRAPHKLKFAISGCTRECAEAQSKDIGVIATENGWNLYVCGNGGMRPRHADLFASDLSKSELIAMIDRVLMFYVSTADRLQRTSVWMENMEGGLDYLKQVILGDSLNLCDSLDEQMARVIDTYQCEWKSTLDNPQKLQRFRPFLNSTSGSKVLPYQRVRGQRIPVKQEV